MKHKGMTKMNGSTVLLAGVVALATTGCVVRRVAYEPVYRSGARGQLGRSPLARRDLGGWRLGQTRTEMGLGRWALALIRLHTETQLTVASRLFDLAGTKAANWGRSELGCKFLMS